MTRCVVSDRYRFIYVVLANEAANFLCTEFERPHYESAVWEYGQIDEHRRSAYCTFSFLQDPMLRALSAYGQLSERRERGKSADLSFPGSPDPNAWFIDFLTEIERDPLDPLVALQSAQLDGIAPGVYGSVEWLAEDLAALFDHLAIDADLPLTGPQRRHERNPEAGYRLNERDLPAQARRRIREVYARDFELYQEKIVRTYARSGRLLERFRQTNEAHGRTFVYRFGSRGFYAELTSAARAMLYCVTQGLRLVIDSRSFAYRRESGWDDYFLPFCADLASCPDIVVDIDCNSDIRGPGTVFNELLAHRAESVVIGSVMIRGFEEILATCLLMMFRFNERTTAEVASAIEMCGLPARYASVHIRRGDKVGNEDMYYPAAIFLDRLAAHGAGDLPLFVLSDDYAAVDEVRAELERTRAPVQTFSLCREHHGGFSEAALRRGIPAYGPADATADAASSREEIAAETIRLLVETVIACRSACFVGTIRSNVGTSIRYLHERPDDCILLSRGHLRAWSTGSTQATPRDMEIARRGDYEFYLFLDIFVHWSGRKITAVAPYYGDDIDWAGHGVDLENVVLSIGDNRVTGRYLPHRLDSLEPCVLFDFEHDAIEACLRDNETIAFTITAGAHSKDFVIESRPPPGHQVAMSVIVRDCNRWLGYFLDYYLACLDCDHVYLYDNRTKDADGLQRIIRPYCKDGRVTYIPWHHRWRNASDCKQIGQIPQQAHSLNKFGRCRWIGFFDYDEYLRVPGRTLKQFLADFDPDEVDGLSFGLRWFMYKGEQSLDEVGNPLLNFFEAKRDPRGRKRQKLIVSPRNVRFLRIHWMEEGKREVAVDDTDVFFHHYYLLSERFLKGKGEPDTKRDDTMLALAEPLIRAEWSRTAGEGDGREAADSLSAPRPRSTEDWIAHVIGAFDEAEAEATKLSAEVLAVRGMCGRRNRHFLNALCAFENCRYLEIGSHAGASLTAAMYGNAISAVAIEDWSQFGGPRDRFMAATAAHRGASRLRLIERDCFKVDPAGLGPFDVFYYDGDHTARSHALAIERFFRCLDTRAAIVIDDWNWSRVREGTRKAVEALDMPIVFEKEIILPAEEVDGMPNHRGRDTWWNGICVMVVDKEAVPLSRSGRRSALTRFVQASDARSVPLEVVVFSKDRACQLDGLLRSMDRFFDRRHHVSVLWAASNRAFRRGYERLAAWYPALHWQREVDFRADLLRLVDDAGRRGARHIMFLVDDLVFTRRFTGEKIEMLESDGGILAVSLRLGDSIRDCPLRGIATAAPDFLDGRRWAWRDAPRGYWDYPMSLDGNVYRLDDIAKALAAIPFRNPNTLEAKLAGQPIERPHLVCDEIPYVVNLALNVVQNVFDNPHAGISASMLNRCFLEGMMLDIEPFAGGEFSACHIQPRAALVPDSRVPAPAVAARNSASERRSHSRLARKLVPVRRRLVSARPDGDGLLVKKLLSHKTFRLSPTGRAIWSLCDGKATIASIFDALEARFQGSTIRRDAMATLMQLQRHGVMTFRGAPRRSRRTRRIDLREVPFFVINCRSDAANRDRMQRQLTELGLRFEFVDALESEPSNVGTAVSHLRVLGRADIVPPFAVIEDDCLFNENFRHEFTMPDNTDAFYLGVSLFGLEVPGTLSWGKAGQVQWTRYDGANLRVFNMLARHAVLYLSDRFRQAAIDGMVDALSQPGFMYPGDVGLAATQLTHLVLTPLAPICYQASELGGNQGATSRSLIDL